MRVSVAKTSSLKLQHFSETDTIIAIGELFVIKLHEENIGLQFDESSNHLLSVLARCLSFSFLSMNKYFGWNKYFDKCRLFSFISSIALIEITWHAFLIACMTWTYSSIRLASIRLEHDNLTLPLIYDQISFPRKIHLFTLVSPSIRRQIINISITIFLPIDLRGMHYIPRR